MAALTYTIAPILEIILFPIVAAKEQREIYAPVDVTLLPVNLVRVMQTVRFELHTALWVSSRVFTKQSGVQYCMGTYNKHPATLVRHGHLLSLVFNGDKLPDFLA